MGGVHRYPHHPASVEKALSDHPVDLLILERGHLDRVDFSRAPRWEHPWEAPIGGALPQVVLESWKGSAALWGQGPSGKLANARWKRRGYQTRCKLINATEVGGAVDQTRLLVARLHRSLPPTWEWPPLEREAETPRPMGNLLRPPGLVPRSAYLRVPTGTSPHAHHDPMPARVGRLIETERGIRRLLPEELAKGLGWTSPTSPSLATHTVERSTSLFHWEYLMAGVRTVLGNSTQESTPEVVKPSVQPLEEVPTSALPPTGEVAPFQWKPPDLSAGGPWYQDRIASLKGAAAFYPNPQEVVTQGLSDLERHRQNYDAEGARPQKLQLLWWEFPQDHWEALRSGSPMNFLKEPTPEIHDNAKMDEQQLEVAVEFVEELRGLGVLRPPQEDTPVSSTAPLFCIPKEGQPGQWRVIADMLRGGQNSCIGKDPVFLPRVIHILDSLYEGGYSAVVDASKFFYQFKTHPADWAHLGIKHPTTSELLVYGGLPMGSGNSPALGSRYGLAFVRKLQESNDLFQGRGTANCYWTGFHPDGSYHPEKGYGYILEGPAGCCVRVWAFVDDFLIHGPTFDKCTQALTAFLDLSVQCGMLCHPKKLIPPQQVVRYCGVMIDTQATPTIRMPTDKKERAENMIKLVLSKPQKEWSRLALAVVVGVLESLAECTPRRVGHTYLRSLHLQVHPSGEGDGLAPFLTTTTLSQRSRHELIWWSRHLKEGRGRVARPKKAATLVPSFGDGSGTGTGGTYLLPGSPLKMWKGKWQVCVHHFSSNMKELMTLLATLEALASDPQQMKGVKETTLFYFTDNSTTYWIAANGSSKNLRLHKILESIRAMEVLLETFLTVVHVPGRVMIQEGTDGLSRGIWMSPWHAQIPRPELLSSIFAPLPYDPQLVFQYVNVHVQCWHSTEDRPLHPAFPVWSYQPWDQSPHVMSLRGHMSVWFPPPELGRQCLTMVLEAYVEDPLHTAALFFIPRIVPAFWRGLSKQLVELPAVYPHLTPLPFPPVLPIPITVMYLPPHHRTMPTRDRLDAPAPPPAARWHQEQAAEMRGVLGASCPPGDDLTMPLPGEWVPPQW